jgi:hypothetical protein
VASENCIACEMCELLLTVDRSEVAAARAEQAELAVLQPRVPFTHAETLPPGCSGLSHAQTTVNASVTEAPLSLLLIACNRWLPDPPLPPPTLRKIPCGVARMERTGAVEEDCAVEMGEVIVMRGSAAVGVGERAVRARRWRSTDIVMPGEEHAQGQRGGATRC